MLALRTLLGQGLHRRMRQLWAQTSQMRARPGQRWQALPQCLPPRRCALGSLGAQEKDAKGPNGLALKTARDERAADLSNPLLQGFFYICAQPQCVLTVRSQQTALKQRATRPNRTRPNTAQSREPKISTPLALPHSCTLAAFTLQVGFACSGRHP
eukprot:12202606-Alexandrium_andersonii.AAC.1